MARFQSEETRGARFRNQSMQDGNRGAEEQDSDLRSHLGRGDTEEFLTFTKSAQYDSTFHNLGKYANQTNILEIYLIN